MEVATGGATIPWFSRPDSDIVSLISALLSNLCFSVYVGVWLCVSVPRSYEFRYFCSDLIIFFFKSTAVIFVESDATPGRPSKSRLQFSVWNVRTTVTILINKV